MLGVIMTKGKKLANAAIEEFKKLHFQLHGKPANLMRYEQGWIVVSCSPQIFTFVHRVRTSAIVWDCRVMARKIERLQTKGDAT
jgi:hypothetical protein